jgi:hypothetical protein
MLLSFSLNFSGSNDGISLHKLSCFISIKKLIVVLGTCVEIQGIGEISCIIIGCLNSATCVTSTPSHGRFPSSKLFAISSRAVERPDISHH